MAKDRKLPKADTRNKVIQGRTGTAQPNDVYPSLGGTKFHKKRNVKRG